MIDGEIVVLAGGRVQPFTTLQKRLNRRAPGKKLLADAPVSFISFDLLRRAVMDLRSWPLHARRKRLAELVAGHHRSGNPNGSRIQVADCHEVSGWDELSALRQRSRDFGVEGLMLKRVDSPTRRDGRRDFGGNGRLSPTRLMPC